MKIAKNFTEKYSTEKNTKKLDSDNLSSITEDSYIERYRFDFGERKEIEDEDKDEETNRLSNNSLLSIPTLKNLIFEIDNDKINNYTAIKEEKNKPIVSNANLIFSYIV